MGDLLEWMEDLSVDERMIIESAMNHYLFFTGDKDRADQTMIIAKLTIKLNDLEARMMDIVLSAEVQEQRLRNNPLYSLSDDGTVHPVKIDDEDS